MQKLVHCLDSMVGSLAVEVQKISKFTFL